ncbi:MAG: anti-sigma factor antagonist [Clostridia bacterium]|nr:anti-sigma factor antagonist [Clostridia bacterium]
MRICAEKRGETLYISVSGELDEHNAARARMEADKLAENCVGKTVRAVFDLGSISFMDSTGIGFLIGRYKRFARFGIPMYVTNLNTTTDKILQMSGIYTIIPKI